MKELSLHILDLVQNSISAGASLIEIIINENMLEDKLLIEIIDNGCGMDEEFLERIKDPFVTTRTSRKVGLGVPLMLAACKRCEGDLEIRSQKNVGTHLVATFRHSHIDRAPIGNLPDTMVSLILCGEKSEFIYRHILNDLEFCFDTREIKKILGDEVSLVEPDVLSWIGEYLKEGISNLHGGMQ